MALRLMQVEARAEPCQDLSHLITLMGRYYQIRDDYLNLTSQEVRFIYSLNIHMNYL
jgi:geranylgeranyl diphosphate synthase type 3